MNTETKTRLTRQDWIDAGLQALREQGKSGVRIVPLAARLKVTTGSFYHHFKGLDALRDALLVTWEAEQTDSVIEAVSQNGLGPEEQLRQIMLRVFARDETRYDSAFRSWALTDDVVRTAVAQVRAKRHCFLTSLFEAAGFDAATARFRARVFRAYVVGVDPDELRQNSSWRSEVERVLSEILLR